MQVVTRFAPSPTGYLHIGGARTALFNWLFARHHNGKFLLRIEDTDRARSTQEAVGAIIDSMQWLGLDWDGEVVYQFSRAARHAEVAEEMVKAGKAYYCYCTVEELASMREQAEKEGRGFRYDGRWRERDPKEAPLDVKPAIRLKAPLDGDITIMDQVQGEVKVACAQLDDMVLLRSDGTPTYMLAVVVDDHDMGITHIIRGDDHLTNAFRQTLIYHAMGWDVPVFAHIPLIHGADGAKLSKRHGALGAEQYREMGYLPEAMRNYLLRLGWAHGNDETISTEQAIEWFGLDGVGKSPSRFDMAKLDNLNGHYLREADDARLLALITPALEQSTGKALAEEQKNRLLKGMGGLKQRAKNINELADNALFYVIERPFNLNEKAQALLGKSPGIITELLPLLRTVSDWNGAAIESEARIFAENKGIKLGAVAQPLRAALTGRDISPGVFEVMEVLGREESLARLEDRA